MVMNIGEMMNTKLDLDEMLAGMQRWIAIESPTDSPEGMARMASQVQSDYESFGARVERIPGRDAAIVKLRCRLGCESTQDPNHAGNNDVLNEENPHRPVLRNEHRPIDRIHVCFPFD